MFSFCHLNSTHVRFNNYFFSLDSEPKRIKMHVILFISSALPSVSALTEPLTVWESLVLQWQRRVNFLVYQSQPI